MPFSEAIRRRLGGSWRLLVRELGAFGVVGGVAFVIDVSLFQLCYAHLGTGAVTAKLLATLASMTVAYLGHRYWSFAHRSRDGVRREYLFFCLVNGLALLVGLGIVALVRYPLGQESALVLQLANLVSIAIGTVIRYLLYRRWVFNAPRTAPSAGLRPGAAPAPRAAVDGAVQSG
jgi:putative flippase GtrA